MSTPDISVVVPSHARRLRLRWLLNALEEQTLAAERFEVIVVHDYTGADAGWSTSTRSRGRAGCGPWRSSRAREAPRDSATSAGAQAAAPLVAFVDDDCRPEPAWLEHLLARAADHPGAIIQGSTQPRPVRDPGARQPARAVAAGHAPLRLRARPATSPTRATLLERVDGFDEAAFPAHSGGEDTDLAMRARATGAPLVAAPEARVYHSVEGYSLPGAVRLNLKWRHLVFVFKRYPELRRSVLLHRLFWRRTHRDVVLLALGLALASRRRPFALLAGPWVYRRLTRRGQGQARDLLLGVVEMPGGLVVDLAEVATMCWGSAAYRTLVL